MFVLKPMPTQTSQRSQLLVRFGAFSSAKIIETDKMSLTDSPNLGQQHQELIRGTAHTTLLLIFREADGSIPMEPVSIATDGQNVSKQVPSHHHIKSFGRPNNVIIELSTYICDSSTSG